MFEELTLPRVLWVGIGCGRGTSRELIETAISEVCKANNLAEEAIAGIATIDTKASEVGLVELCRSRDWVLQAFPADILKAVTVPNPSSIVLAEVGTSSVAEAAALCAIGEGYQNPNPLLVPKQIFRFSEQRGAVTIAIAQSDVE